MQEHIQPDWGEGLPVDLLALVAGGRDDLKEMRSVRKTWQQGFESSVTVMRQRSYGSGKIDQDFIDFLEQGLPALPSKFSERFPALTLLDLSHFPADEQSLRNLAGLKHLRSLILGPEFFSTEGTDSGLSVSEAEAGEWCPSGLTALAGLQLDHLSLRECSLVDQVRKPKSEVLNLKHMLVLPSIICSLDLEDLPRSPFLCEILERAMELTHCHNFQLPKFWCMISRW